MSNKFVHFFCVYVITLCFGYFFYVSVMSFTGHAMPDQVKEIVICVMGIAGGIGSYVVGSSISSRNKDKALNDALNNNQNQQP